MEPLSRTEGQPVRLHPRWSADDTQASGTQRRELLGCLINKRITASVTAGISWDQVGSAGIARTAGCDGALRGGASVETNWENAEF